MKNFGSSSACNCLFAAIVILTTISCHATTLPSKFSVEYFNTVNAQLVTTSLFWLNAGNGSIHVLWCFIVNWLYE